MLPEEDLPKREAVEIYLVETDLIANEKFDSKMANEKDQPCERRCKTENEKQRSFDRNRRPNREGVGIWLGTNRVIETHFAVSSGPRRPA